MAGQLGIKERDKQAFPYASDLSPYGVALQQPNFHRKLGVRPVRVRGGVLHSGHVPVDGLLRELESESREEHCQDDLCDTISK